MRWLALVIFLFGCATTQQTDDIGYVSVSYSGIGEVVVYASLFGGNPQRIGQVISGQEACLRLPRTPGTLTLFVRELGSRDYYASPEFSTNEYKHWKWELHIHLQTSRINLYPSTPCRRKR